MDRIILRRIPFNLTVGTDAWNRKKPQPVLLSLEIPHDVREAAANDDISRTLDYGKLYKSLTSNLTGEFSSVGHLVAEIRKVVITKHHLIEITMPKANLRAEGGMHFTFDFWEGDVPGSLYLSHGSSIKGLHCPCIVGVNQHEREEKQIVVVNLDFKKVHDLVDAEGLNTLLQSSRMRETVANRDVVQQVVKLVEGSVYQTVEALATIIAKTVTVNSDIPGVWVEVEKPNAIAAIEAAGVRIYREKSFFTESNFWQVRLP